MNVREIQPLSTCNVVLIQNSSTRGRRLKLAVSAHYAFSDIEKQENRDVSRIKFEISKVSVVEISCMKFTRVYLHNQANITLLENG